MVFQDYLRLTDNDPGKSGYIWNRNPVNTRKWEAELQFQITNPKTLGGDGLAFWYTKEKGQEGPVFGSRDNWVGLGVFIDTYDNDGSGDNPHISVIVNDGTKMYNPDTDGKDLEIGGCKAMVRRTTRPSSILVRYNQDSQNLQVEYSVDSGAWMRCVDVNGVDLPTGYYFGVSAATGGLSDIHDVFKFTTRKLDSASQQEPAKQTGQQPQGAQPQQEQQPQQPEQQQKPPQTDTEAELERLRKEIEELKKAAAKPADPAPQQPAQPATPEQPATPPPQEPATPPPQEPVTPPPQQPATPPPQEPVTPPPQEPVTPPPQEPATPPPQQPATPPPQQPATPPPQQPATPPPQQQPPQQPDPTPTVGEATVKNPEEQKPTIDPALIKRLSDLEVRVKQTNEKLTGVVDSVLQIAAIGESLESLTWKVPNNAPDQNDVESIRKEVEEQMKLARSNIENTRSNTQRNVDSRIERLRSQVSSLTQAFNKAEEFIKRSGGNGLLIVFIIVQIAFAATMFYLYKNKEDQKKLF